MNKNEEKKELKLSYISQSLWWKREFDIKSKEWKNLRKIILERDKYKCYFCEIQAYKYMIIDHISGDAFDNSLENLRVLCPMCDTIRHSGLAGIMGTLRIASSQLSQLEIVKRTQRFFLTHRILPSHRQLDPKSRLSNYYPIEIATLENVPIEEKLKCYKGFFTKKALLKGRLQFLKSVFSNTEN